MSNCIRGILWPGLLLILLIASGSQFIYRIRVAKNRDLQEGRMQRINQGLLGYLETKGHFPKIVSTPDRANSIDSAGLSWRVKILPLIGHQDLYARFRLDEPWDSDHNSKLIGEMPECFRSPGVLPAGHTSVHVFVETNQVRPETPFTTEGVKLKEFTDGTLYTILAVVAGPSTAEPWSKPGYLEVSDRPLSRLGNIEASFCVACADGTVRTLSKDRLDNAAFRAILTHDGAEFGDTIALMRSGKTLVSATGRFDELFRRIEQNDRIVVREYSAGIGIAWTLANEKHDADRRRLSVRTALFIVDGDETDFDVVRFCEAAKEADYPVICILNSEDQTHANRIQDSGARVFFRPLDLEVVFAQVVLMSGIQSEDSGSAESLK